MRIGLNLLYLMPGIVGGTETYAKGLVDGLKRIDSNHEFILFLNRESAEIEWDLLPKFKSVVCPISAMNRGNRYYFEHVKLRRYLKQYRIDLLHSLGYISPLFVPCLTVASVPDLNFKAFGNAMSFTRRMMLGFFVRQTMLRADKIVTISEFSREEILREYQIPPQKVVVTHLAADSADITASAQVKSGVLLDRLGINSPYMVAFVSTYPNKNIPRLIEAYRKLRKEKKCDYTLVLIGHKFPHEDGSISVCDHDGQNQIIWTGYLTRNHVNAVLQRADFLVFPSFYEGFGLPVLEAMIAGVPVVCSRAASLPEVAGDAAVFFDPLSVEDMAEKIGYVAGSRDLRQTLRDKGFKNIQRFSWKQTATKTLAVYDELIQDERQRSAHAE